MAFLQYAKGPIWANRSLLPEATTNPTQEILYDWWSLKSGCSVCPKCWLLFAPRRTTAEVSSEKAQVVSQPLRPCANPPKMAQVSLQELAPTSLFRLQLYCSVFRSFPPYSRGVRYTSVSQMNSGSSSLRGHVIHGLQPRGGEQHNRAKAVEECRPLSPCGGSGPIKCLRWHDFSPQKCP